MENVKLDAVFIFKNTEGITELRIPAHDIEQRNGWLLALWNKKMVGCVREEYIKACYLQPST